eukprot:CAMPEP_0184489646 /NCGR_PEP_ID=MMETSP0113_2-20130426/16007_1 /TAXON_ID=91329 /ORGANISM="Norrisiella sphaerica, Strain BC52" /LENGTH=502 /DNA_ID=CAMNT_0026873187 /DNA_START=99 /DNA_END=1607 /DNA_ORIENTATION=+
MTAAEDGRGTSIVSAAIGNMSTLGLRAGSSTIVEGDRRGAPPKPFMEFSLTYDPYTHKAKEYKITSCARPHMRAFHLAWTSFLIAFIAWFSFAPLGPAIKETLDLDDTDILIANVASVGSTVLARFAIGPIMDVIGPRLGQTGLLVFSAIPTYFAGLIQGLGGLATVRALTGVVGATFVGCQFWCSLMFTKEIAGTVNALAGGWGNLGGGITQAIMIGIYNMNLAFPTCDEECAWRNAFYIPATALLCAAGLVYYLGDDCPKGQYVRESTKTHAGAIASVAKNIQVWILVVQYAVCFGVELHVNNTAALYYYNRFGVSLTTAGLVASLFGLMNLFARAWGGMLSDYTYRKWGMTGRKYIHITFTIGEGVALIVFSRIGDFGAAIFMMIIFSLFVQSAEGSTFAIVPYVDPSHTGSVCGFVGAGGNMGAVLWGVMFIFTSSFAAGYLYLGVIVIAVGITGLAINVKDTDPGRRGVGAAAKANTYKESSADGRNCLEIKNNPVV